MHKPHRQNPLHQAPRAACLLVAFGAMLGCASNVEHTIPLTENFANRAQLIVLKSPTWRHSSHVYNMALGGYSIDNTHTSWVSSQSQQVGTKVETNIINFLLFDDSPAFIASEYEVDSQQRFSFSLNDQQTPVALSKCSVFSQGIATQAQENVAIDRSYEPSSRDAARQKTYLACTIEHNSATWQLSLRADRGQGMKVQLKSNQFAYHVKGVSKSLMLVNNGTSVETREVPPWAQGIAGLEIFNAQQQVCALTFLDNPKIWLDSGLPPQEAEVLLAVTYSLTLFNWLDEKWRD